MNDEAALLASIVADADEDTPRLAYADWLDEHGDPDRAAFIRVQCRLADLSPAEPDWIDLIERQSELVARLKPRFLTILGDEPDQFYFGTDLIGDHEEPFRRGFPHFIACQTSGTEWTAAEVARVAAELARLVRTTTLRGFEPYLTPPDRLTELLAAPAVAELSGLSVSTQGTETELAVFYRHLGTGVPLHRVKQLFLYGRLPAAAVAALARAKTLGAVRRLSLLDVHAPAPALDKLTRAPWLRRLRHLRCFLDKPLVATPVVAGLGALPELHTLDLPSFAARAVGALAAGEFPALARLMYGGPLGPQLAKKLAQAKFPALAALEAPHGMSKNDGLAELLNGEWFGRLRVLDLSDNGIGDKGMKALAAHPVATTLRVLKLGDNVFGASGLGALASEGAFPELTTLHLGSFRKRKGTPAELAAWLAALRLPRLRHLDLMGWPLGSGGAKALAQNPALAGLTRLNLENCGIGDLGAKTLFASPHLQNLVELHLSNNAIKSGADALADPAVLPRLGECDLSGNKIAKKARAKLERAGLYLIT